MTASKNVETKITTMMGNVKNKNNNGRNDNERGGQGQDKNKNMVYTKNKNDNQPGFEQPIKEAGIGNEENNHRNANGRHCYNRNSNDWIDNIQCQTQWSTMNLLRLRTANNQANVSTQDSNAMNNNNTSNNDEGTPPAAR